MTFLRACLAVIPVAILACDLPPKDIGDETETQGSSEGGGVCVDGDVMPADDGCNTCECLDGQWACTLLGCGDEAPPVCEDGAQMPAPDGCNDCTCIEGAWACTEIACPDDAGPACEDGDTMPAPDGCNTCSCDGGQWACTAIGCEPPAWFGDEILLCDPGAPTDQVFIDAVVLENDSMNVTVSYGGGCEQHDFGLCWDGIFAESSPVQIGAFISHEDHGDPCEAAPTEELSFDLVPLRQTWQEAYLTESGTIEIHLDGWDESILYSF